jgi:hypothetical protein
MQVSYRFEKSRNFPKFSVGADLFQMGLGEAEFVAPVGVVRTIQK